MYFDSGYIYSFIAPRILRKLGLTTSTLPYTLKIVASKGEPVFSTIGFKSLEFEIQGESYS